MSDMMSDFWRDVRAAEEIQSAAEKLADALDAVHDLAFGYPEGALEIANAVLRRAHVKLKLVRR